MASFAWWQGVDVAAVLLPLIAAAANVTVTANSE